MPYWFYCKTLEPPIRIQDLRHAIEIGINGIWAHGSLQDIFQGENLYHMASDHWSNHGTTISFDPYFYLVDVGALVAGPFLWVPWLLPSLLRKLAIRATSCSCDLNSHGGSTQVLHWRVDASWWIVSHFSSLWFWGNIVNIACIKEITTNKVYVYWSVPWSISVGIFPINPGQEYEMVPKYSDSATSKLSGVSWCNRLRI